MFKRKQIFYIYMIGIFLLLSGTSLFYYFYTSKNYELTLTTKEIDGVYKLKNIYEIMVVLKHHRGLSQIDPKLIDENREKELRNKIFALKDEIVINEYDKLKASKAKISKEDIFSFYTMIIRLLEKELVNIGDSSTLLFEANRENYFLMTFLVYSFPSISDYVGHVRGIGSRILSNKSIEPGEIYDIQRYKKYFYEEISRLEHILSKIKKEKSVKLFPKLNSVKNEFESVSMHVSHFESEHFDLESEEFFSLATIAINKTTNFYDEVKIMILEDFNKRKKEYEATLISSSIIYAVLVVFILLLMVYLIKREKKSLESNELDTISEEFISFTRDELTNMETLRDICDKALELLCEKFGAISGSIYVFNESDKKLYLGSAFNVEKDHLEYVYDLRGSYAGEVIRTKSFKEISLNKSLSIGNFDLDIKSVVTLPLHHTNTDVGVVQLSLLKPLDSFDSKLLNRVTLTISNYLYKAKQSNDSLKYVELVDKNVLTSSTNLQGVITYASEAFCELSQYTKDELVGSNHNIIRHDDMSDDFFKDLWKTISSGKTWKGEIKNKKKDGTFYWVESTISPDYDLFKNIVGYTAIRSDITLKKQFEESSITDMLTGLYNRRHFEKSFPEQVSVSKRDNKYFVFALMDIDHFKQYNDTYGHQEGDTALKKVSKALSGILKRTGDMSFRLGGEEFGMIYKINEKDAALHIANRAKESVENLHIPHIKNSASKYVTISMGLFIMDKDDNVDMETIYKHADDALYEAKENGRNQIKIHEIKDIK